MIKTLRESKAKLSELVEAASRGEEVLITVKGKVKARLTRATPEATDMQGWAAELRQLQERVGTGKHTLPSETLWSEGREDRV